MVALSRALSGRPYGATLSVVLLDSADEVNRAQREGSASTAGDVARAAAAGWSLGTRAAGSTRTGALRPRGGRRFAHSLVRGAPLSQWTRFCSPGHSVRGRPSMPPPRSAQPIRISR
jgi:hypothetical protein